MKNPLYIIMCVMLLPTLVIAIDFREVYNTNFPFNLSTGECTDISQSKADMYSATIDTLSTGTEVGCFDSINNVYYFANNTDSYVSFTQSSGMAQNGGFIWSHFPNSTFQLTEDTEIEIEGVTQFNTANYGIFLAFGDNANHQYVINMNNNDATNPCAYASPVGFSDISCCQSTLHSLDIYNAGGTYQIVDESVSDLVANCPEFDGDLYNTEFTRYSLYIIQGTTVGGITGIRTLNITNVNESFNQLPEYDILYNDTNICYTAENWGNITFNFEINATDNEGDEILYAFNSRRLTDNFITYDEDFVKLKSAGTCQPDYAVFNTNHILSNYSFVNTKTESYIWMLHLNPNEFNIIEDVCNGYLMIPEQIDRFLYDYKLPFNYDTRLTIATTFPAELSKVDFFFIDSSGNRFANFTINQTVNLSLFVNGDVVYNALRTPNTQQRFSPENEITITTLFNYSDSTSSLNFGGPFGSITTNFNATYTNIRGFEVENHDYNVGSFNQWGIKQVRARGLNRNYIPNFSPTIPNTVDFTTWGTNYLDFYITDDYHLDNLVWQNETILVTVDQCDAKIYTDQYTLSTGNVKTATNSFRTSIESLCNVRIGLGNFSLSLCFMINFVYVTVTIALSLMMGFFIGKIWGLLTYDIFAIFGMWALPFSTTYKVIVGVISTITVAMILMRMFTQSATGGNDNFSNGGTA